MKNQELLQSPVATEDPSTRLVPVGYKQQNQADSHAEKIATASIGWILQGGVLLSAAIIVLGILLLPLHPGELSPERMLAFPTTLNQVVAGLLVLRPQAVITLGLLLLIATPVIRVAASILVFAFERDRKFVIITFTVLVILLGSLFLGSKSPTVASYPDMRHLHFSLLIVVLIFLGSIVAGMLGSLVGLGGGILIVPLLTLEIGRAHV